MQLLKLLVDMGSTQSTENKEGGVVKSSSQTEGRRVSIATKDPLGEDHMSADSDVDEDDDEEESDSGDLGDGGGEGGAGDSPSEDAGSEKTAQPLTEYFVNVVSDCSVLSSVLAGVEPSHGTCRNSNKIDRTSGSQIRI